MDKTLKYTAYSDGGLMQSAPEFRVFKNQEVCISYTTYYLQLEQVMHILSQVAFVSRSCIPSVMAYCLLVDDERRMVSESYK